MSVFDCEHMISHAPTFWYWEPALCQYRMSMLLCLGPSACEWTYQDDSQQQLPHRRATFCVAFYLKIKSIKSKVTKQHVTSPVDHTVTITSRKFIYTVNNYRQWLHFTELCLDSDLSAIFNNGLYTSINIVFLPRDLPRTQADFFLLRPLSSSLSDNSLPESETSDHSVSITNNKYYN